MPRSAQTLSSMAVGLAMMTGAAQAQYIKLGQPVAWQESGEASWYGGRHHGRPTSSGEVFNQDAMTAAHHRLPLGSRVRVTRTDTGSSVIVTINDRQPDHGRRIIDLSRGAASRLGLLDRGTGPVVLASVAIGEPVEVAEAPEEVTDGGLSPQPRGRRHRHRDDRADGAGQR